LGVGYDAENLALPLDVTPAFATSRTYADAPADVLAALQTRAAAATPRGAGRCLTHRRAPPRQRDDE
jgi:hypothetical protein